MKSKWFLLALVLLTVINLSMLGTFAFKRWRHGQGKPDQVRFLTRHLALNPEQVARMKDFQAELEPKMAAYSQNIKANREALVQELRQDSPDAAKIELLLAGMDSTQAVQRRAVINNLLREKTILSPEQQEKFFDLVRKRFGGRNFHN